MSHKHYEALAVVIKNEVNHGSDPAVIARMAQGIADICENDNPRFDRVKFYVACGTRSN